MNFTFVNRAIVVGFYFMIYCDTFSDAMTVGRIPNAIRSHAIPVALRMANAKTALAFAAKDGMGVIVLCVSVQYNKMKLKKTKK